MIKRLLTFLFLLPLACLSSRAADDKRFEEALIQLEEKSAGRLGVAVLDTETGHILAHRGDEHFAMASTFKAPLAAAVLARVDAGQENLSRMISYGSSDLLSYAPVTGKHIAEGEMSVADLCQAAVELSDNTAANLLLVSIGGPAGLTKYLRSIGDEKTRLDRNEPTLNTNLPDDQRDTTTPVAMAQTLAKLLTGDALSPQSRQHLTDWMIACQTGATKLRAGLDPAWKVGDKTGSGENGASNDIAIVWPEGRNPIVIAAYSSGSQASTAEKDAVIAEVGKIISAEFP